MIDEIYATIKCRMVYTCATCGKTESGTTVRVQFGANSTDELCHLIDGIPVSSKHMPVGWSFGNKGYNCGCGKK